MSTVDANPLKVQPSIAAEGMGTEPYDDEIDLGEYLAVILQAKGFIALVSLLALAAGVFYALTATPIFKADALIQVESKSKTLSSLEDMQSIMGGDTQVAGEVEIIKSRMVQGKTVDELKLDSIAEPKYFPYIGRAIARRYADSENSVASPPLEGLGKYAWGGEKIELETFSVPESLVEKPITLVAEAEGRFHLLDEDTGETLGQGMVGQRFDGTIETGEKFMLFVSYLKARPGTEFVLVKNSRANSIDGLLQNLTVAERGKKSNVLELTLTGTDPERIRDTLNSIANSYLRQNVERKSAEAEKTLSFLDKQLPSLKSQMDAATEALNAYRIEKGSADLTKETSSVLESVVKREFDLTELKQKREEARTHFTPEHPQLKALDAQIARMTDEIRKLEDKVHMLPETQQVVLRLTKDVEVSAQVYTTLLNSAQEMRIAKAGTIGNVRIVDYAVTPTKPIKPKKRLIAALSLLGGVFLGVVLVFMRRAMQKGVEDPDLIEKHINLPVYATISHSDKQAEIARIVERKSSKKMLPSDAPLILALAEPEGLTIESFRSLRTTLHFATIEAPNKTISITSSRPGVGKSFISVNLSSVLCQNGKRVLLIDADMRKGRLNRYFGLQRENGLSEWVSENLPIEQVIHPTAVEGLDIIPTGTLPPNPSELLMHHRFSALLEKVNESYDYVLVDTPPILAVTDAAIVGQFAGATLMVAKAGAHPMRELQLAVKRLQQSGTNVRGFIFNDVPQVSHRYGYGYGYGKYVYQYAYKK